MNPIHELASLLPPAPPSRDLPHRDQHEADLLAIVGADPAAGAPRSSGLLSSWRLSSSRLSSPPLSSWRSPRWLAPSAAAVAVACAVVIVAVTAIVLPELSGSGTRPAGQPTAGSSGAPAGPPSGSPATVTQHWVVPSGSFTSVVVSTNNGPVRITGSVAASAAITVTSSYRGAPPVIRYQIAAGALTVHATCPQERHCQVALQLRVPARTPVRVRANLGSVRLTGLTAGAVADSDLGNIYLTRVAGSVTAQTELGQVSATGLTAYRAALTTAQGSVDVAFSVAPELVTASSQLGSVTIRLPSGTSYAVTATADLGSTSVTVPQSRVSRHVVKANSQLGSVTVAG